MKNKKILMLMLSAVLSIACVMAFAGCGSSDSEQPAEEPEATEEAQPDMDALWQQVAEQDLTKQYAETGLTDEVFANAEVFGIDTEGESNTAYVYLNEGEFVVVKDKAYEISGGSGEAIVKFDATAEGTTLTEVIWSADGSDHEAWLEENFPAEYLETAKAYEPSDKDGNNKLNQELSTAAEEALGVPVETENLLEIDLDNGTYTISSVSESGDPGSDDYKFETTTIEEGSISDLTE